MTKLPSQSEIFERGTNKHFTQRKLEELSNHKGFNAKNNFLKNVNKRMGLKIDTFEIYTIGILERKNGVLVDSGRKEYFIRKK